MDELQKAIGDLSVEHEKTLKALEAKSQGVKKRLQAANLQVEAQKSKIAKLEREKRTLQAVIDATYKPAFKKAEDAYKKEKASVDSLTHLTGIITSGSKPARNEEIVEYAFASYNSEQYLKALREGFGYNLWSRYTDLDSNLQSRLGDYETDGTIVFSDVPKGDAWLLWDERTNLPLQGKEQSDYFEKPVFVRIPVKGPAEFDITDLKRVPLEDVSGGEWPTDTDNDYDNCLRLNDVDTSSENALMQMCQDLFPDTARGAIMVSGSATSQRRVTGVLMSGKMARRFADAHIEYMSDLRKLASRSVPESLLPFLTNKLEEQHSKAKQAFNVAEAGLNKATKRLNEATTKLEDIGVKLATAISERDAIATQQDPLTSGIRKELEGVDGEVAAAELKYKSMKAALEAEVGDLSTKVKTVTNTVIPAFVKEELVQQRNVAQAYENIRVSYLTNGPQDYEIGVYEAAYGRELSKGALKTEISFKDVNYFPRVCVTLKNTTSFYLKPKFVEFIFKGKQVPLDIMTGSKYNDFYMGRRLGFASFNNKYSEPITGMKPGQVSNRCEVFVSPYSGDPARFFERVGGFNVNEWQAVFSVDIGQLSSNQKSIAFLPYGKIFPKELSEAQYMAITKLSSEEIPQKPAVVEETKPVPDSGEITKEMAPKPDPIAKLDRGVAKRVQEALNGLGFATGTPDGILGAKSKAAIANWQKGNGFPETGELTESQLAKLLGSLI